MTSRLIASASLLVLTLLVAAGCDSGPKRYGVSGTVTYKDQPIESGIISFVPKGEPAPSAGASITNGKYEVPDSSGLLPGEYEVIISVPTAAPAKETSDEEEGPGEGGEKATAETLPAKYNSQTELKAVISADGDNEFDFHLK